MSQLLMVLITVLINCESCKLSCWCERILIRKIEKTRMEFYRQFPAFISTFFSIFSTHKFDVLGLYLRSLPLKGTTWIPRGPPSFDTSTSLTMSLGWTVMDGETEVGGVRRRGGGGEEEERGDTMWAETKTGNEMRKRKRDDKKNNNNGLN